MIIAVYTEPLLNDDLGSGYFFRQVFTSLTKAFPDHQFYFLSHRSPDKEYTGPNAHSVVTGQQGNLPILSKHWYETKIARTLKKIRADVLVSTGYVLTKTEVPQCLIVYEPESLRLPAALLKKATTIATVSESSKKNIITHFKTDPKKISVVYSGVRETFRPLSFEDSARVKERYTEGKEYFIYAGTTRAEKNLVNILKAFSIFKKRQQSSMKLVLAGKFDWKNDEFPELLKKYKFREDVVVTEQTSEETLSRLIGSAYAFIHPSVFEGFGEFVLEAMKCNVPVVTSEKTSMQEIGEDAALYFDPRDHQDMADKLMLIYKDEALRSGLIEKGKIIVQKYSWEKTADLLWKCIGKTVGS